MEDKYNVQLTAQEIMFAYCRISECYSACMRDVSLRKFECKEIGESDIPATIACYDKVLDLYEDILKAFGEIVDTINENERIENNV